MKLFERIDDDTPWNIDVIKICETESLVSVTVAMLYRSAS